MNLRSTRKGFTLIEFIIYIALSAIVLVALLRVMLTITGTREKTEVRSVVQQEVRFTLDRMESTIVNAVSVNEGASTFGSADGVLSLEMNDSNQDPTIFRKVGSGITIQIGTGSQESITSDEIEVEELLFTNLTALNTYGTVRIRIQATDAVENPDATYADSFVLQSSVSLRQ